MLHFWDVAAFIATAVAFVFIGLVADLSQLLQLAPLVMLCFVAALVARYLSTEMVLLPASRLTGSVSRTWRNTACLAGIRGAVSVALALSLPEFPFKGTIVAITFGVVLFSLLVQTELLSYYVGKAFR
jgi:CPA1 family monovalent cation:H+ antiporter